MTIAEWKSLKWGTVIARTATNPYTGEPYSTRVRVEDVDATGRVRCRQIDPSTGYVYGEGWPWTRDAAEAHEWSVVPGQFVDHRFVAE